jgi:HAD superfamily hydrolase (TIGR01484 family)
MSRRDPLPIDRIPKRLCERLVWVFTDIDDTLTTGGLIPSYAFDALWQLHDRGIHVVPVTGRPAGWCDHIARMWPVSGVVGENGAFYFVYDRKRRKMRRRYSVGERQREQGRKRLKRIKERVLVEVKGSAVAADQPYRISDLAIDFCEDVEPLDRGAVKRICDIAREEGAVCKVSSIHVNCWYGHFDKISCVKLFLREETKREFEKMKDRILFIGDSPNDEPMFKEFSVSIGVANLSGFLEELEYLPQYITSRKSSMGFREAIDRILGKRDSTS